MNRIQIPFQFQQSEPYSALLPYAS
uniref:Uncharacterized protein n=1 Tax=Arundo donax TaxID=35708 RepID=A0A0A8YGC2_ARUDO